MPYYHKPLHCGAGLVLAAMLGLAAPQPLLSGQVITPAELPPGLRAFALPMKVVSEISFTNHRRPELSRRLRVTWYHLSKEDILHYFHRDGEMVVYSGPSKKMQYWASKCDSYIEHYFDDRFSYEHSAMAPYLSLANFFTMLAEQPTVIPRDVWLEPKLTMEPGAGFTTFTLALVPARSRKVEFLTHYVVDEQGRPVSYSQGNRYHYLKSPDGSPQEFYYRNCFFSDYFELPGGLSFPRIVKGWHKTSQYEWSTRVEEVTLLAEGTTSREVLRQLTQHLPERQCSKRQLPKPVDINELVRSPTHRARAVFAAAVALLAAVWLMFRLRGRRI